MSANERLQAYQLLLQVTEKKSPLLYLLQKNEASPLTKNICFGVCRHYLRLEAIADQLTEKRPELSLWLVLLIGLYQLHFLAKPEYASVKETVNLVLALKKPWAKGLVNAVLRRYCREKEAILAALENDSRFQFSHPAWFIKQVKHDWPDDWHMVLVANDAHPPMNLRINQRRSTREDYLLRLEAIGIKATANVFSSSGIQLATPCDVLDLPGFAQGDVSLQDEAAQLAVGLLESQPGHRVLDACCAPGGKTCHILESQTQLKACVALDNDRNRLQRVHENLQRLGLDASVLVGDACAPDPWWDGVKFDRILLDAPCSATGVIRRHPDIKLLRKPEDVQKIILLQHQILRSLWPLLADDGLLIYATCSVLKKENDAQIERFLADEPSAQSRTISAQWGCATPYGRQLLPGATNCDGFYYAALTKK